MLKTKVYVSWQACAPCASHFHTNFRLVLRLRVRMGNHRRNVSSEAVAGLDASHIHWPIQNYIELKGRLYFILCGICISRWVFFVLQRSLPSFAPRTTRD